MATTSLSDQVGSKTAVSPSALGIAFRGLGTAKKSAVAIAFTVVLKKGLPGHGRFGFLGACRSKRETVFSEISKPSLSSSLNAGSTPRWVLDCHLWKAS
jgi:hypothetical protein